MSETVAACPECDAANVSRHAVGGASGSHSDAQGRYRCTGCGAYFDAFVERERKQAHTTRRGLAGELANASAAEVVGDE